MTELQSQTDFTLATRVSFWQRRTTMSGTQKQSSLTRVVPGTFRRTQDPILISQGPGRLDR